MFKICKDTMRLHFDFGDRDIALAFADMEGYEVVCFGGEGRTGARRTQPAPIVFNESLGSHNRSKGAQPEQVSQGIYSYKLARKTRPTYATGNRRGGKRKQGASI